MKTLMKVVFLLVSGGLLAFQLYYELGFGSDPANWQREMKRIENVSILEETKQGSLQKHGTCFHFVSKTEEGCVNSYYDSGRVSWKNDLSDGYEGYVEIETFYLKPFGIYKQRMEKGGLVISCPKDKWTFHLPPNYTVRRIVW